MRNLLRDPRITVLAHSGTAYTELLGVMVAGNADFLTGDGVLLHRIVMDVFKRYHGIDEPELGPLLRNRVAIRVRPTRIALWDHCKLG